MNILTFDLEEWFHLLDHPLVTDVSNWNKFESRFPNNVDRILDYLDIYEYKCTFFCLGWIAKKYPNKIIEISRRGHEIACHSNHHVLIYKMSPDEFYKDTSESIDIIQNVTGKKIISYRAPGFSLTERSIWMLDILVDLGIIYDSSIFPMSGQHGGISSFPTSKPCILETDSLNRIKEFPMSVVSFFNRNIVYAGGGYFRLIPYPLLKLLFNTNEYNMTYFHPRDFDAEQPILPNLSTFRKFKSYYGLKNAGIKFSKLLENYKFTNIINAGVEIDWDNTDIIKI